MAWLPDGEKISKISLFVLAQLTNVTDRQTDTAIWPTIFISPQKVLLAPSGPLRGESALSLVFTVALVTDVLLQLDHISGTTYLPVCETRKSAAQNLENN